MVLPVLKLLTPVKPQKLHKTSYPVLVVWFLEVMRYNHIGFAVWFTTNLQFGSILSDLNSFIVICGSNFCGLINYFSEADIF